MCNSTCQVNYPEHTLWIGPTTSMLSIDRFLLSWCIVHMHA